MSGAPVVSMNSEGKTCYVYPRAAVDERMTEGFVATIWKCTDCFEKCWGTTHEMISLCEECSGKLVHYGQGRWTSCDTFTMDAVDQSLFEAALTPIRGVSPQPVPLQRGRLEMMADELAAMRGELERHRADIARMYKCPACRAANKVE